MTMVPFDPPSASTLGVRIIADRVVLRIEGEHGWRAVELSLDQARAAQTYLADAVSVIERGASVLPSLGALLAALPVQRIAE